MVVPGIAELYHTIMWATRDCNCFQEFSPEHLRPCDLVS
jgi:hypothetical protein